MMFWYGGGWAFWQVALMWVVMIAFWALLIWAVWALIIRACGRQPGQERREQAGHRDARAILDERLARGEIDTAEYQRLRDVLAAGTGGDRQQPAGMDGDRQQPAGTGSGR